MLEQIKSKKVTEMTSASKSNYREFLEPISGLTCGNMYDRSLASFIVIIRTHFKRAKTFSARVSEGLYVIFDV